MMKSPAALRNLTLAALASLSLGGCYYGDVYSTSYAEADCSARYGDGYWSRDPYAYDDGYYGYDCYDAADYQSGFVQIGFGGGWYQSLYYPGYGLFLFDRYGRRHNMGDDYLTYWGGRRAWWRHHGRDHDDRGYRRDGDGRYDGPRPGRGYHSNDAPRAIPRGDGRYDGTAPDRGYRGQPAPRPAPGGGYMRDQPGALPQPSEQPHHGRHGGEWRNTPNAAPGAAPSPVAGPVPSTGPVPGEQPRGDGWRAQPRSSSSDNDNSRGRGRGRDQSGWNAPGAFDNNARGADVVLPPAAAAAPPPPEPRRAPPMRQSVLPDSPPPPPQQVMPRPLPDNDAPAPAPARHRMSDTIEGGIKDE